ncbi:MAG: glycosyltransferase [Candidatus Dormibacteraeota bacterium]|nr:glycosyltransferase [Candidatus Dormibacteraeota bacterium]
MLSIVIPVFNHWDTTVRCLQSLARFPPSSPFEIVVVDDASTDETQERIARVAGVRVTRNERNVGFLESVNAGVAAARGEYVVLLNNDTQVEEAWWEPLLDALQSSPDVAAVGSRLDYPDGSLQEAGGIIWNDGTGLNYGRYDDPLRAEYGFRRDVDYCSAAALTIRRSVWNEIGGFDLRFAPGYYEDTDFCFEARRRGYRILYEPRSIVTHDEGGTFGTEMLGDIGDLRGKVNQFRNRYIFCIKWEDDLCNHWPPGTAGGLLGGHRDLRPRVLVVDHYVPTWDQDSGSLRMSWILRLLNDLGCQVTFFALNREETQPYSREFQRLGIEIHHGGMSFTEFAAERAALYDLILLSRPGAAEPVMPDIKKFIPHALSVYDTVDLHFVRETRRAELEGRDPGPGVDELRDQEIGLMRDNDITAFVSQEEAATIHAMLPELRTLVLPNVHEERQSEAPGFDERAGLFFIGGFRHLPNIDAMTWFVAEVLPIVRKSLPDVTLDIVGSLMPDEVLNLQSESVSVAGWVPDADPFFDRARLFVCPLRYGAGLKGKIGQALANGLPVVTTSVGAEGMHLADGSDALVADSAEPFAAAVIRAYHDKELWHRLQRAGLDLVRERYSPALMRVRLAELLAELPLVRNARAAGRELLRV